jgi:hypothetical protein
LSIDDGLRLIFRRSLTDFHWTSIETGGTGLGIADSNYLFAGGTEGWVEYKRTDGWAVTLDEFQAAWIFRRARLGGRAMIAVRRRHDGGPRRGPAVDELYLVPGALALVARAHGLRDPVVRAATAVHHGGPAGWDWPGVAALLLAAPLPVAPGPSLEASARVTHAPAAPERSSAARRRRSAPAGRPGR